MKVLFSCASHAFPPTKISGKVSGQSESKGYMNDNSYAYLICFIKQMRAYVISQVMQP